MKLNTPQLWLSRLKKVAVAASSLVVASALPGCLDRPLGQDQPRTTNVLVDLLSQNVVDKVDMLFVIDNSLSMRDKQEILKQAVPDLVGRFVDPVCVNADGQEQAKVNGNCPQGYGPEFNAIDDIHIGVITTSLGGFGSEVDCVPDAQRPFYEQKYDMAHLLGGLPRASATSGGEFLSWNGGDAAAAAGLSASFQNVVAAAGEQGCGWEASLEAWLRFLVDPYPYTKIVRRDCTAGSGRNDCAGPELTADGAGAAIDNTIIEQRNRFLRMDSLLAVIMLTDENDCSFKAGGQSWILSETRGGVGAFKGSSQCAANPNDPCCQSCGAGVISGCPSTVDGSGNTRAQGCEEPNYEPPGGDIDSPSDDQPNLRCFKQKQRFGVDFLYPVERYSNALDLPQICPSSATLDPEGCAGNVVDNPVFNSAAGSRAKSLVFFGGIVGVPWQDLAQDPTAAVLKFKKTVSADGDPAELINWDWLIGGEVNGSRELYPTMASGIDPLMYESVDPRTGVNPATNVPLAPPGSGYMANPINGHEWTIVNRSDLQYACIFPLTNEDGQQIEIPCPNLSEVDEQYANLEEIANCDCTYFGGDEYGTPLCQTPTGAFDTTQRFAKAYPSIRPLQALEQFAQVNPTKNAIVASICPKEVSNKNAKDFGYRPAVATIVERLKEQLQEPCLPRPLSFKEDGSAACIIVEATKDPEGCPADDSRFPVDSNISTLVYQQLQTAGQCRNSSECAAYKLCGIPQINPPAGDAAPSAEFQACISGGSGADGWCYVDQAAFQDADPGLKAQVDELLNKCPDTEKRKLRFAGKGAASTSSSLTFFACSGALFDTN